jgi:glycosyltransferase involved in cell wall biosynthesis
MTTMSAPVAPLGKKPASTRSVFVMEQGLGHVVHTMNLEKVLETEPDMRSTVLRVRPGETPGVRPLPLLSNWSVQTSWATRSSLRQDMHSRPADAVFIHTQVAALFARRIMRQVPTIVSLDATPINFDSMAGPYGHARQAAPLEYAKLQVNRRALTHAAAIVTWSRWAAESVIDDYRIPGDRVHAIYPGVDLAMFQAHSKPEHPGPLRVLFVGGDFARKGGPDLVAAVSGLPGVAELDIVTSEPLRNIPRGAPIRVHNNATPKSALLSELYRQADVFALPSLGDCTPLAIAEAMAFGLPIVATRVGSIPDMVHDGRNGILVSPGNPAELARALQTLASRPAVRQRMGSASRSLAEEEHDMALNWRKIFDLMRAVAAPSLTSLSR